MQYPPYNCSESATERGTPTTLDMNVPTHPTGGAVEGDAKITYKVAITSGGVRAPPTQIVEESPQTAQSESRGIQLTRRPPPERDKEERGTEVEEIDREKEEAEKRLVLERVERDLSRYAAGYEAGRIESVSREQTQRMEDTVRLMKELQGDLKE